MVQRFLLLMIISFFSYSIAFAGQADCGLGTEITQGNKSIVSQTIAYTTNGTSHITTVVVQTSGCDYSGIVQKEKLQEYYIGQTYINLEEDAARGEGPYASGLAELMECVPEAYPAFAKLLQTDFDQLFEADLQKEDRKALLEKIKQRIKTHAELAAQCKVS